MNDIIATVTANPVTVLIDEKTYSEFYARMKAETDQFVADVSTVKGRGEIAAIAYKVTRTKTAIDAAGKKLNEDARAKINAVDASRRKIRDELDALADAVRKPLTEWEDAEKERSDEENTQRLLLNDIVSIPRDASAQYIADTLGDLRSFVIDPDIFRDATTEVVNIKQAAIASLEVMYATAVKAEADAAELSRLRAEAEAREIAERERIERENAARIAAENEAREKAAFVDRVKREKEQREREQAEAAERERLAVIARAKEIEDATNAARAAEQKKRDDEAEAIRLAHEQEIENERAAARAIENARAEAIAKSEREHAEQLAKIEAENKRLAKIEADRLAEIDRTKREEAARQADRAHRSKIMGEAKAALIELGASEDIAKKIVLALVAGEIPHAEWRF